jgi:hypothetical protein
MAETARRVREHLGDGATFAKANIAHYTGGRSKPRPQYLAALNAVLGEPEESLLRKTDNGSAKGGSTDVQSSRPMSERGALPPLHVEDRGGEAWLQINQQVPWPVALEVLRALKGEG